MMYRLWKQSLVEMDNKYVDCCSSICCECPEKSYKDKKHMISKDAQNPICKKNYVTMQTGSWNGPSKIYAFIMHLGLQPNCYIYKNVHCYAITVQHEQLKFSSNASKPSVSKHIGLLLITQYVYSLILIHLNHQICLWHHAYWLITPGNINY